MNREIFLLFGYCAVTLSVGFGCSSSSSVEPESMVEVHDVGPEQVQDMGFDVAPETAVDAALEVTVDSGPDWAVEEVEILADAGESPVDIVEVGPDAVDELTESDLAWEIELSDTQTDLAIEDWHEPDLAEVEYDVSFPDVSLDLTEVLEDTSMDLTADVVEIPAGLVHVEPGTFWMGSPPTENCRANYEGPQHEVTLTRALLVMEHEVTYAQWDAITGAPNPSVFGPEGNNKCGQPDCPVELVNWYEALTYANMLSESEGLEPCYLLTDCTGSLGSGCSFGPACEGGYECANVQFAGLDCEGYRLPTEAEWEYLARAGTSTAYAYPLPDGGAKSEVCGECAAEANLEPHGWYCFNSNGRTHPVKGLEPNSWGLYDMSGNVWEWCWDRFSKNFYANSPAVDPICDTGSTRVTRSGNWSGGAEFARVSERFGDPANFHSLGIGFRLVRTVSQGF